MSDIEYLRQEQANMVRDMYNGLKETIWRYMKEHPVKDNLYGVVISPATHNLILDEVEYGGRTFDGNGQAFEHVYAKKFHFEEKDNIRFPECQSKIDEYERIYQEQQEIIKGL